MTYQVTQWREDKAEIQFVAADFDRKDIAYRWESMPSTDRPGVVLWSSAVLASPCGTGTRLVCFGLGRILRRFR